MMIRRLLAVAAIVLSACGSGGGGGGGGPVLPPDVNDARLAGSWGLVGISGIRGDGFSFTTSDFDLVTGYVVFALSDSSYAGQEDVYKGASHVADSDTGSWFTEAETSAGGVVRLYSDDGGIEIDNYAFNAAGFDFVLTNSNFFDSAGVFWLYAEFDYVRL